MAVNHKKPIWEPRKVDEMNITKFMTHVNQKHGLQLRTYEDLHQWSVGDETFQDFWRDAYTWLQLAPRGSGEPGCVLSQEVTQSNGGPSSVLCLLRS